MGSYVQENINEQEGSFKAKDKALVQKTHKPSGEAVIINQGKNCCIIEEQVNKGADKDAVENSCRKNADLRSGKIKNSDYKQDNRCCYLKAQMIKYESIQNTQV